MRGHTIEPSWWPASKVRHLLNKKTIKGYRLYRGGWAGVAHQCVKNKTKMDSCVLWPLETTGVTLITLGINSKKMTLILLSLFPSHTHRCVRANTHRHTHPVFSWLRVLFSLLHRTLLSFTPRPSPLHHSDICVVAVEIREDVILQTADSERLT